MHSPIHLIHFTDPTHAIFAMNTVLKRARSILWPSKLKIKGDLTLQFSHITPLDDTFLSPTAKSRVEYFLHVEVSNARDLIDADMAGLSDSFVVLRLNGVEFGRTEVVNDDLNPVYVNEAFEIPIFRGIGKAVFTAEVRRHFLATLFVICDGAMTMSFHTLMLPMIT